MMRRRIGGRTPRKVTLIWWTVGTSRHLKPRVEPTPNLVGRGSSSQRALESLRRIGPYRRIFTHSGRGDSLRQAFGVDDGAIRIRESSGETAEP